MPRSRPLCVSLWLLVPVVAALAYGTQFYPPTQSTDHLSYAQWLETFSRQFWSGDPFPRWLAAMNHGLGQPTFVYYGPLAYWIAVPLEIFAPLDPHGLWRVLAACGLTFGVSGLAFAAWRTPHDGPRAATVAGLAYLLMPYHLIDFSTRVALAELWVFVWMPVILLGIDRMAEGRSRGVPLAALGGAALILTHPISAMTALPALLGYPLFCRTEDRKRLLLRCVAGGSLALVLTAFFWVPALVNVTVVDGGAFTHLGGAAKFESAFLRISARGFVTMLANAVAVLALLATCLAAWTAWKKRDFSQSEIVGWLCVAVAAFVPMLPMTAPLWHALSPLRFVQFPWRFQLSLCVAATVLLTPLLRRKNRIDAGIITVTALAIGLGYPLWGVLETRKGLTPESAFVRMATRAVELRASPIPEYRTRWTERAFFEAMDERLVTLPRVPAWVASGRATIGDVTLEPDAIRLSATVESENAVLTVRRFYFPGWKGAIVVPSPGDGLLQVVLPHGEHKVSLRFAVPGAREGNAISLLGFGLLVIASRRRKLSTRS